VLSPEEQARADAWEKVRRIAEGTGADLQLVAEKFEALVLTVNAAGKSMQVIVDALNRIEPIVIQRMDFSPEEFPENITSAIHALRDRHIAELRSVSDPNPSRGPRERRRFPIRR
jgi:hypothetical protein